MGSKKICSIKKRLAEESLKNRIAKGPPLPGPGSTYEQGFIAGWEAAIKEARKKVKKAWDAGDLSWDVLK